MANTYYVGSGGNDGNSGLTWALRKLTLNGAEDIPVAAGDTVYVAPGTYKELLTTDVSGTAGNQISYIGDYDGSHTDGTGGIVRITGSDDNKTATRGGCINVSNKDYRTFQGFYLDIGTSELIYIIDSDHFEILDCYFGQSGTEQLECLNMSDGCTFLIDGCYFSATSNISLRITGGSDIVAASGIVSNCIIGSRNVYFGIRVDYIGDMIVKNCLFNSYVGIRADFVSETPANPVVVNNCIFNGCTTGVRAMDTGGITEDYNCFSDVATARNNVDVGIHSNTYYILPDTRWFFEMVNGGSMLTPFDLASYSEVIDLAGTSPTTSDIRGTTVKGTQREWGALEYDSDLDIEGGGGGDTYIRGLMGCG